ncbi:MAG: hypothetical protein ACM3YO_05315 [Bacteroidota bacterium]
MVANVDFATAMQQLERLNELVCSVVGLNPTDPEFSPKFELLQNALRNPQEGALPKEAIQMIAQLLNPDFEAKLKALEETFSSAAGTN